MYIHMYIMYMYMYMYVYVQLHFIHVCIIYGSPKTWSDCTFQTGQQLHVHVHVHVYKYNTVGNLPFVLSEENIVIIN